MILMPHFVSDPASQITPTRSWVLAFDASAPRSTIAVGWVGESPDDTHLIASDEDKDGANQCSIHLVPRIEAAVQRAGIQLRELSCIAVGCGPGIFTGSRVAVATAKGLALGLGVPCLGLSTLACLAASAPGVQELALNKHQRVLATLDARRNQVYGAIYRIGPGAVDFTREGEEQCTELAKLLAATKAPPPPAYGPGVGAYGSVIPEPARSLSLTSTGPTAKGLWRTTVHAWHCQEKTTASELEIVYLRASYAEMGINKPKRPVFHSPLL